MTPARSASTATAPRTPNAETLRDLMPLVHTCVARFLRRLPPNVLRDDLVAAGTFGLIDALRRDPDTSAPQFEWYARIRIRGAIVDELRAQDWLTRRAREKQAADDAQKTRVVGFDDLPNAAEDRKDSMMPSPLDCVEQRSEAERMAEAVAKLPEREQYIVKQHYFEGVQFKAIAATLGVSEPRVSQLHSRAMQQLRAILEPAAA
jgi:RNA polymerase sigma factor for flagellar operon FliA